MNSRKNNAKKSHSTHKSIHAQFKRSESWSRLPVCLEFVPDMWCIKIELFFFMFCFDTTPVRGTLPEVERSEWFVTEQQKYTCANH